MVVDSASTTAFQPAEVAESSTPKVEDPLFNLTFTDQSFNDTLRQACEKLTTGNTNTLAGFPELSFCGTDGGIKSDRIKMAELSNAKTDSLPPGISFKNIDATPGFQKDVEQSFSDVYQSLNPETQAALKDVQLITASRLNKAIPGEMPQGSAVVPATGGKLIVAEKGIFGNKQSVPGVMKHEVFHLLEDAVKAGQDPELLKAIDTAISRMPKNLQTELRALPKRDLDHFKREFMADSFAMALGTQTKELGYLHRVPNAQEVFREAIDVLKRKYIRTK
ncbi:MAG: hypothetical protein K2X81_05365 [Candidatus Obscuribacterales bacterium]|nr:hypothetical protein [Candidatus Obscuribacterales bacterium]